MRMNWLICQKMFTYFCNKCRPVNRMYYIKCGVNSLFTHIFLAAAEGLWHLGSLFYHNTQYSQRGWYITNLLLCDIPWKRALCTGPRHIWCTCTLCPFFGREKNTDGRAVGLILLPSVCYGYFCWGLLLLFLFIFFFLKIVF